MWRIAGYLALALVVTMPGRGLLGNPDVDVWNHVWGYWWFAHAAATFTPPWHTTLLGAPGGGVLWFVDPLGALAALPITAVLGPAAGLDAVLVTRVALAGLAAHALCEEVWGRGAHAIVAGVAYATSPFLLCELANGISEVAATWWVPAALLAAARAFRIGRLRDYAWLGVVGGLATVANFYYGLTAALLVGAWAAGRPRRVSGRGALLAGVVALGVAGPGFAALRASVQAPDALVRRSASLNLDLAAHNAVDPRVYVMPGAFWSVDLAARYGEPFRHTGYLRWSVLLLAAWAAYRDPRRARGWVALGALSLVLGLGPYLWWDGQWVRAGGHIFSLPFQWLQRLVPELAITHPLRLSIGAQAIAAVLAGGALRGVRLRSVLVVAAVPMLETVLGSAAQWPVPVSPVTVPAIYATIAVSPDARAVLDLPAEVGTTMATSRYFFYQTVHHHPVPYTPDARGGSTGDPATFTLLQHPIGRPGEQRAFVLSALDSSAATHLRAVYGWVIVHPELTTRLGADGVFEAALTPTLGAPETVDGLHVWRLAPP